MANRILLKDGCSMSTPSVFPKNWKSGGQSLIKKDWRIQYYFYDPAFKDTPSFRKLVVVKGMNAYKTVSERREATKIILQNEIEHVKSGYNPITKKYAEPENIKDGELHPDLYFMDAFCMVLEKFDYTEKHKRNVKGYLNRLEKVAAKLKLTDITIDQLKRRQLKSLLEKLDLPEFTYNKYVSYLGSLFTELLEYECCETNLCRDIRRKKTTVGKRKTLTASEFDAVSNHLKGNCYEFWRFSQIFIYSGARISELIRLQAKDVDLINQEYTVEIKKGGKARFVQKVILQQVVPFWTEILARANPKDFLFSAGLVPGKEQITAEKIGKRWKRWVKDSTKIKNKNGKTVKITADFYAYKHYVLDRLPLETAKILASHSDTQTTAIYRVNQEKRDREMLKNINIDL